MATREEALSLLHEYVKSKGIRNHCYAVAASMEAYAEKYKEDKDKWWICGLLHDFDYEKYPTIPEHTTEGVKILRNENYPEDIIEAILGHAEYTGVPRNSLMAKCLFALDELSGFVVALAYVKQGFDMDAESVKRALKKKGFAAAISREDIEKGITELRVNREEHFNLVIHALEKIKEKLVLSTKLSS